MASQQAAYAPLHGGQRPYMAQQNSYGTAGNNKEGYGDGYDAYGLSNQFRPAKPNSSRKKVWWIVGGVVLLAAAAAGIVAGILVSRHNSNSSLSANNSQNSNGGTTGGSSSGGSGTTSASGSQTTSAANSAATFAKDPRLHQSFYAMAYETPGGSNYPNCNDTIESVIAQVQILSQLTTRLRTYGADCNQTWLIQEAIQATQVNMSLFLGVYMSSNASVYERQIEETLAVLKQFGTSNVLGIQVGNEYILDTVQAGGSQATAQALVLSNVQDTKRRLAAAGYGSIPVGSGDAGEYCSESYAAGLDFVMCNDHPFFAGVTINQAPTWPYEYVLDSGPSAALTAPNNPTVWQGEVGWPSQAIAGGSLTLNGSIASLANMQYMLNNFVCASNVNTTATAANPVLGTATAPRSLPYVWFTSFDLYVNYQLGGVEPFWGLFDENNNLKDLTIPNCAV